MTLVGPAMRLRCPRETPETVALHLAIDVRLPCSITVLDALSRRLPRCGCGASLVIDCRAAGEP